MAAVGGKADEAAEVELQGQVLRLAQEKRELQDYADRVTRELRRYQQARPAPPPRPDDDLPLPPWATNMQMMSPLLCAYEERIAELEAVIERSANLAEHTQVLAKENDTLRAELHEKTRQLRNAQVMAPMHDSEKDGKGAVGKEWLEDQYGLSREQNEALAHQNQLLKLEIEKMHQSLVSGQQQLREVQEGAAQALAAEQSRVAADRARSSECTQALTAEQEQLAQALNAEQHRSEAATKQREAAVRRLEEVTGELVEELRSQEQLQIRVADLEQRLEQGQESLDLYRKRLEELRATSRDEEEHLKSDLERVCLTEQEQRQQLAALEQDLAELWERLHVAQGERDALKRDVEFMAPMVDTSERQLRDLRERHSLAQTKLSEHESQVRDLVFERECLRKSEVALKRQAERSEDRLQSELAALRSERDHSVDSALTAQRCAVAELEETQRRVEHKAEELQARAELAERQRLWEASASERQEAARALERERLNSDLEESQQARLRVEREAGALRQEALWLKAELGAASAEAREQVVQVSSELAASRARCQSSERRLAQAKESERLCETRAAGVAAEQARLKAELGEERLRIEDEVEAGRRRAKNERRVLEQQLQNARSRAQQEEQRAAELGRAQETLRQRWQAELGHERELFEAQVERLSREQRVLKDRNRVLRDKELAACRSLAGGAEMPPPSVA